MPKAPVGIWIFIEPAEKNGCRVVISDNGRRNEYPKILDLEEALSSALMAQEIYGLPDERVCVKKEAISNNSNRSLASWKVKKLLQLKR